jgi:four helix bundle protein
MSHWREAPYKRLHVWQAAHELTLLTYRVSAAWPPGERFGLTNQARRAAVSVELNIAEGAGRRGSREFARFLSIAIASLTELECALEIARDLRMITSEHRELLAGQVAATGGLLWGLLKSQRRVSLA